MAGWQTAPDARTKSFAAATSSAEILVRDLAAGLAGLGVPHPRVTASVPTNAERTSVGRLQRFVPVPTEDGVSLSGVARCAWRWGMVT